VTVQRVLVRQGVDRDLISILLEDFAASVAHFDKHPVSVAMTPDEAGGFSVNGQFLVPARGQQKSQPFTRSLLLF
jgi:hypothetical protein